MSTSAPGKRDRTSLVWVGLGGLMMTASMFFRYVYGPMGGEISHYRILSGNLYWESWPMLLGLWPIAFGLLEAVLAAVLLTPWGWSRRGNHWLALALFLACVALTHLGGLAWFAGIGGFQRSEFRLTSVVAAIVLVTLVFVAAIRQPPEQRSAEVQLLGAAWILVVLYPISDWVPIEAMFWAYGVGYWLLLGGTLLIAATSIRQLLVARASAKVA